MLGQTNRTILANELQRKLRRETTPAEAALWHRLRAKRLQGHKFRRQHPFNDYILDLVCVERRLVIEVDGGHHLDSASDRLRDSALQAAGFRVLRLWNHDVLHRIDAVLELILSALKADPHHPLPSPPLEGEGEVRRPGTGDR